MPIILIEKDPFVEAVSGRSTQMENSDTNVRRPLLGISPKPNTFAYMSLQTTDGGSVKPISILDSSAQKAEGNYSSHGHSNYNHNFILQAVSLQRQEKTQVIETFGQEYAFFFGQRAQFMNFTGFLLNTGDFNWKNEWLRNYDLYLRGTRCVENRARVFVGFDDVLVSGYVVSTNIEMTQDSPNLAPFSFQMLVSSYTDISSDTEGYVRSSAEARQYPQQDVLGPAALSNSFGEYMTATQDTSSLTKLDRTGALVGMSATGSNAPSAIDYERSASWLSGPGNTLRQEYDSEEGLKEVSIQKYMQENSVDRTTAILAYRSNAGSFSLGSRDDNTEGIEAALGSGIASFCGVVSDEFVGN